MAKIQAFPDTPTPDFNKKSDKKPWRKRLSEVRADFFPEWVPVLALGLFWLFTLPGMLSVVSGRILPGLLSGAGLVLASTMAIMAWDTYGAKWKTAVWAILISFVTTFVLTKFPDLSLLLVVVPTGLFVALRVNMNARRLLATVRDRRYR